MPAPAAQQAVELSITIVNWRTARETIACVRSVESHPPRCSYEILVLENGSGDDSFVRLREAFAGRPNVHLVHSARNLGFGAGQNLLAQRARGRLLLMLNPDCRACPGAIDALVRFMRQTPRAGAAGPLTVSPEGQRLPSCRRFPTLKAAALRNPLLGFLRRLRPVRDYLMADYNADQPVPVDWVSGACLIVRKEVFDALGGFDERFFMYCEDMDLCLRMKQAGWLTYYVPQARFVHAVGRSSDHAPLRMIFHHHRSMYLFYRKHMARGEGPIVRALVPLGAALRFLTVSAAYIFSALFRALRRRPGRANQ